MEDEHIRIDDLSEHLGSLVRFPQPCAFYGVIFTSGTLHVGHWGACLTDSCSPSCRYLMVMEDLRQQLM